ncbi:MAG: peptide chain release factor 2 [Pseudonocardiales bacterium]|nr:peptide chain release factor 2 [Pseudonocardiales bacterium]
MNADVAADLKDLDATLSGIEAALDIDQLRAQVAQLQEQAARPDLWNDVEHAQQVNSKLAHKQGDLRRVEGLRQRLEDVAVLYELAEEGADESARSEAEMERDRLRKEIASLEIRTLLSGEYDERDALVTIRSEAGGVDAADWAEMLMRMYLRWAERHGYPTEVYDISFAEEAGIKSATFVVKAPFAYGTLSVEQGTHRLVRISPFDNQARRQTSFAGVEVLPVTETADHVDIPENEIRIDVFRSSGPGGQSVNTTDSAVRITHLPTGIVVSCQNEKSQIQNRIRATEVLRARLQALAEEKAQQEASEQRRSQVRTVDRSERVRTYNFPENRISDHRVNYKAYNLDSVLDGDLDGVLDALVKADRELRLRGS